MRKLVLSILSLCMIASLWGCGSEPKENPETIQKFNEFIENDFIETMESDYTTMHVYLEHPEKFGIDPSKVEVALGSRPDKISEEEKAEFNETVKAFESFERDELSAELQET